MTIFINNKQLDTLKFYGGECHVKIDVNDIGSITEIYAGLNNSDDIMFLLLAVDAVRRVKVSTLIHLTIPYFPYARQDRVCNEGESLSVKVMADIINNLNCAKVIVYDPHSDVTSALINNCHIVSQADIIASTSISQVILNKELALVSPDAGAEKKTRLVAKRLASTEKNLDVFCSSKIRNTLTGEIVSTEVHGNVRGKNLLIIDDICDGGRTFIELAKALKECGASDIYLYVTHGIFSKGLDELASHFKHIYCYHTMLVPSEINSSNLTILQNKN